MPERSRAGQEVDVPHRPTIDGLRFRTYRGPEDVPALVALYRAADAADRAPGYRSEGSIRNELANWTHLDPTEDLVVATIDAALVAAVEIEWADTSENDRHYQSLGVVHPRWRRHGLGRALLGWSEARRTALATTHSVEGSKVLMTWLNEADIGGRALLVGRDYEHARSYVQMIRPHLDDIDVPDLPVGLEVRPVSASEVSAAFDALSEAFRDHHGGHDGSAASLRRFVGDPRFDRDLLVVAFDGDEVAGGVFCIIDSEENEARGYRRGWTDPIFVRRPWRRRGLASALLGRALLRLRDAGMTSAQLDVDTANPNSAFALYRRHGFVDDVSMTEWHKPVSV